MVTGRASETWLVPDTVVIRRLPPVEPVALVWALPLYFFFLLTSIFLCVLAGVVDLRTEPHEHDGGRRVVVRPLVFDVVRWGRYGWADLTDGNEDVLPPRWRCNDG